MILLNQRESSSHKEAKKTSVQRNGKQKGAITMLPKPELQKTSPYSHLLGRLTKKKNKKAQSHSLLPFPYVCSTSQFPTELQFHTSYRCTRDRQMHTGQYLASAPTGLTQARVSAHTTRHSAIKAVWSLLRFPR